MEAEGREAAGGQRTRVLDLDVAREALESTLQGEEPRGRPMTKKRQIQELKPTIMAMRAKGFTWEEIAAKLSGAGGVSKDTLRHAIRQNHGSVKQKVQPKKSSAGSPRKAPAVSPVADEAKPGGQDDGREGGAVQKEPASWAPGRRKPLRDEDL